MTLSYNQENIVDTHHNAKQNFNKLKQYLRIIRSENVGPVTFKRLMQIYKDPARILYELPNLAAKGGKPQLMVYSEEQALLEIENNEKVNAKIIHMDDPLYPPLLRIIPDAPPVISVKYNNFKWDKDVVAMVGARNCSLNAKTFSYKLSADLAKEKLIVISGLARGIDTCAHLGALNAKGVTVAVMPGGIDRIYPEENEGIFEEIQENGMIISEMPVGTNPTPKLFPRRNRIIAGSSLGVIVIEAALRSGSLITAKFAMEYHREILAVPGFPDDIRFSGNNMLIKQGAHLIENFQDVLDVIANKSIIGRVNEDFSEIEEISVSDIDKEITPKNREFILDMLSTSPTPINAIIRNSHLTSGVVLGILLELELAGKIYVNADSSVTLRL